ncbi:transposase [Streptomyces sioyaensis]|uniref:transposase n=1 Tax=Streptomyces sioyaensis TaxID=67364 RepID=UPI00341109FD
MLLRRCADRTGLTSASAGVLSSSTAAGWRERAGVLVQLAVAIVLGAENLAEAEQLQLHHRPLCGCRGLGLHRPPGRPPLAKIAKARARVRRHVWTLLHLRAGAFPRLAVAGKRLTGWTVIDIDTTIITAASKKTGAAATFKKTFGFHPMAAWCANTTESLAMLLRPGNTVADHIAVLTDALTQIPGSSVAKTLVRVDGLEPPTGCWNTQSPQHRPAHGPLHRRLEDHRRRRDGHRPPARDRLGNLPAPELQPPRRLLRRGADWAEHTPRLTAGHAADPTRQAKGYTPYHPGCRGTRRSRSDTRRPHPPPSWENRADRQPSQTITATEESRLTSAIAHAAPYSLHAR